MIRIREICQHGRFDSHSWFNYSEGPYDFFAEADIQQCDGGRDLTPADLLRLLTEEGFLGVAS